MAELARDPAPELYQDVLALGGLVSAVQDALTRHRSPLKATGLDLTGFPAYCRIEADGRFSQIYMAKEQRLFIFDFWEKGVCLANASTPSLPDLARYLHAWIAERHPLKQMGVHPNPGAQSYIDGTEIEDRWASLLRSEPNPPGWPLLPFLLEAAKEPVLKGLFPFTSMTTLCFSRCTGYPYSSDCPHVIPLGAGRYQVMNAERKMLGAGSATEAVRLVLLHLPPGCGRAIKGTADDLEGS